MPHLHPDRLIELAVHTGGTVEEHIHLAECPNCRAEITSVGYLAERVAAAEQVQAAAAPDRLWAAIRKRRDEGTHGHGSSFVA